MSLTKKRAQRRWSRIEESEESETPPPIETPTPRRDFLRKAGLASLFGLGGLAAGTFLSPNVRAPFPDPPTSGALTKYWLTLVPSVSRPAGIPDSSLWMGTDEEIRIKSGASDYSLEKIIRKGAASGYASLDGSILVPVAQLGTGTADATKFLRGDRTWQPGTTSTHDILSATHPDALEGAVVAGDLLIGNATPKWAKLGAGGAGQVLTMSGGVPAWVNAGAGAASYYGVRAEDHITSGTGTDADPYNASAIENAINALSSRGGIVFVKAGIWRGSRILLGATGQAGRDKHVVLWGEGADIAPVDFGSPNYAPPRGTFIQCGFTITDNRCHFDAHHITFSPATTELLTAPTLKFQQDGLESGSSVYNMLQGETIENCGFVNGSPALWWTGVNIPSQPSDPVTQHWNIKLDRVGFFKRGGQCIKMDNGDAAASDSSVYLAVMRNIFCHHRADVDARTIDIDAGNLQLILDQLHLEDCAQIATDYTVRIRTVHAIGVYIRNVLFGDGSNAVKDAYLACTSRGSFVVRGFEHRKDVDVQGNGDFQFGRETGQTGVINILSAGVSGQGGIILRRTQRQTLNTGTLNNPENVLIDRRPLWSSQRDHIVSPTAGTSPYTFTNTDARMIEVHLVGGTISDVSRNGQSPGTNRVISPMPGKSTITTHSAAPTIRKFALS